MVLRRCDDVGIARAAPLAGAGPVACGNATFNGTLKRNDTGNRPLNAIDAPAKRGTGVRWRGPVSLTRDWVNNRAACAGLGHNHTANKGDALPRFRRTEWRWIRAMLDLFSSLGYPAYALALVALWGVFGLGRHVREGRDGGRQQQAMEAGDVEPASLHPIIDPSRCVGCSACTHACPEGRVIGMIGGKAQLLDPVSCIGHGACKTSCPVGAIELVFGSARRGVDIPVVSPQFESNVPGLYIAGELGGMGLIANAIEQGRQAIDAIARRDHLGQRDLYDVIIVGGGPAGIAASLAAKE